MAETRPTPTADPTASDDAIRPFRIDVPQADLDDLHRRLADARWPDPLPVQDFQDEIAETLPAASPDDVVITSLSGAQEELVLVGRPPLQGPMEMAGPGEVVMHQNVSICQSIVTSCFDWHGSRNKLVSDGLNFPSNDYIYYGLERLGARICRVRSSDGITLPTEQVLDAIDEQTLLVSVSHVAFRSSFVQDIAEITRRAHELGALVVADLLVSSSYTK